LKRRTIIAFAFIVAALIDALAVTASACW